MLILPSDKQYWNTLSKIISMIPLIIADGASCLYYLIRDLDEALEKFILTGKTDINEFHVFPEEQEQAMIGHWKELGLSVKYRSQQIEYMSHQVTITYLNVSDLETGMAISLIPWFMMPDRPYPIFTYLYAIWYYRKTGEKSLSQSAAVAGELFGIKSLNKSTVSRTIKAMENFIDLTRIDRPLEIEEMELPTDEETIMRIPEILRDCPSIESLEEIYIEMVKRLPAPINRKESARRILSGIPYQYAKVTKEKEAAGGTGQDKRRRPPRPRNKESRHVQRRPVFVNHQKLEETRIEFIGICRCLVLNATATYHRFLI